MTAINHQNNFGTNLTSATSAGDTTSPLNSIPSIDAPFYIAFDATNINGHYEVKQISSKTATNVLHTALSYAHTTAEEVRMVVPAEEMDALNSSAFGAYSAEKTFDFVASGCVWSGDAYASTLLASMTAGVVYIGGDRVSVSAITAHAFTASKDTYIDVGVNGTVDYTEVANNAASPALSASHIRLGIIVTGATNIAAATSINQGQESMVLPIASSIAYSVTDSLGNLICPRDPNRKILGYKQIITNFGTASATAVQVTGLSVPVIVPTGRKIKISIGSYGISNPSGTPVSEFSIWDGVVPSGTRLAVGELTAAGAGLTAIPGNLSIPITPTATSKTYNMGLLSSSGTTTLNAGSTFPAFIMVELV